MRIISVKLPLIENADIEKFFSVIVKWLEKNNKSKNVGEKFKQSENKINKNLCDGDFSLETLDGYKNGRYYLCLNVSHKYGDQDWSTEAIFEENNDMKFVIIHINCSGNTATFDNVPNSRSEIIREFIDSGLIKQGSLPIQRKQICTDNEIINLLADIICGKEELNMPLIYVSKLNSLAGHEVDAEKLAERLAGIAYVIEENSEESSWSLRSKVNTRIPFNGYVGIYYSRNWKILKNYQGYQLVNEIVNNVVKFVNAQTDLDSITIGQLKEQKAKEESKENKELYEEYSNENDSLIKQLDEAKEKISTLTKENMSLRQKIENMQKALKASGKKESLLDKFPIEEFFEGEQHDLLVTILKKASKNCGGLDTRQNELINEFLKDFNYIGNGRKTNEVVKHILSSGEALNERDLRELENVGFKLISETNHYKVVYKDNDRYWFTISKSPSDIKSGKNNARDIIRRLSVYQ